ncbi:MAG TPA: TPM domain-containing protein [Chitinophagales bacterium]|nr:TPM domain-containing protein [Chitinophagales bacterium]
MSKRLVTLLSVIALVVIGFALHAQQLDKDGLPLRPNPPRLVNDFGNVFSASQEQQLENRLVAYDDSTSTQIVVLTMPDIGNWEIAQFSYGVGDKWGVGRAAKDNGLMIVLAMKTHDVFIATGRGAEGAVPDAIANRIVEDIMIPRFRQDDFYGGVDAGVTALQQALRGEFKGEARKATDGKRPNVMFWVILAILIIWILTRRRGGGRGMIGRRGYRGFGPVFFPPIGGGFGGGGFGGGGFGGGGGGFGGFGGGSFGGGGAGGRW